MAYVAPVQSSVQLAVASAETANLSNTLVVTTNTYFQERQRGYSSIDEVKEDLSIPTDSPAYRMLLAAFKQPGVPSPVFLGRRLADTLTLTPSPVKDNADYNLTITVIDDLTNTPVTSVVSINSGGSATATSIATALFTDMTVTSVVANVTVVDNTGSITITADSGYTFSTSTVGNLVDTYVTTETAPQLLAALQEENNEAWYFLATDDSDLTFMQAMADEIEATESSLNPKMFMVFTNESDTLTPLAEPATDDFGTMKEGGYFRTAGFWNHDAEKYPNVTAPAYNGQAVGGTTTWTSMTNQRGLELAQDPVTGKQLSTAKQGYITDRNCSHWNSFKGSNRQFGGKTFSGVSIDVIRAKDYLNDQIIVKLVNLLDSQPLDKIAFSEAYLVTNAIDSVLQDGVNLGILEGYEPAELPATITFEDKAERILQQVKWVGYLDSPIEVIIVSGKLTYRDEEIS